MKVTYSPETLDQTPERVLAYYMGLRNKTIRAKLRKGGLTVPFIEAGRERLMAVVPLPDGDGDAEKTEDAPFAEITTFDEREFSVLEAGIAYITPEVAAWVFDGIAPAADQAGSVQVVTTVLDRLERTLASAPDAPTAPPDLGPHLETLGYGKEERKRLSGLVGQALTPEALDTDQDQEAEEAEEQEDKARTQALLQLKRWFDLAAAIARRSGLNRSQLIRLGLAKRKSPVKAAVEESEEEEPADALA